MFRVGSQFFKDTCLQIKKKLLTYTDIRVGGSMKKTCIIHRKEELQIQKDHVKYGSTTELKTG